MERVLQILALIFILSVGCPEQGLAAESGQQDVEMRAAAFLTRQLPVAVPADPQPVYRVCSSRPQRLLPPFGSSRHTVSGHRLLAHRTFYSSFSLYGGRARMETAPFPSDASCDYYVFALKHLLC
ncbi:hypothetical protein [Prevotella sp. kh1p2]|uniref:hypothetical protein n=1 Tax=Prevotella sp. kh1p2 TaxID=1761883 RepID=UPI0008B687D5|nr:hypothetical protein [Prevotella sp. kh1p2]SET27195.1 hypothetical protein SAMN04487825_12715 [Prevotella sp. kh1p2]SNU12479.1 hypothetical protein SAMN06298210_12715 [Prevotellaceae bacterium KH2P17]